MKKTLPHPVSAPLLVRALAGIRLARRHIFLRPAQRLGHLKVEATPPMSPALRHTLQFLLILAATTFGMPVGHSQLPSSKGAPKVGDKAPDFTLPDSTGKLLTLSHLFSDGKPPTAAGERPAWVLLIFYRGYW